MEDIYVQSGGWDIVLKNKIQYKVLLYIICYTIILLILEVIGQLSLSYLFEGDSAKADITGYVDLSLMFQGRPGQLLVHYTDMIRMGIFGILLVPYMLCLMGMIRRVVTAPLLQITKEMSNIRDDECTKRLESKVQCEFLQLEDEFNRLMARLEHATKQRQKSEDEKLLLISGMAHDLKTPMTTIRGYAQAFQDGVIEDNQSRDYLEAIYRKTIQMDELITVLFDYTRLGTKQYQLNVEELDLVELIRESIGLVYTEYEEKKIRFDFNIPNEKIMIWGDRVQLGRVFANLFSNGLKYNHAGDKICLEVNTGMQTRVIIKDSGELISEEMKEKIFDPFVMGDYARKSGKGNGLGLCVASKIMELHHGRLYLNLEVQEGYTKAFIIEFDEKNKEIHKNI